MPTIKLLEHEIIDTLLQFQKNAIEVVVKNIAIFINLSVVILFSLLGQK